MSEETKRQEEELQEEKKGLVVWIKEHRKQLTIAGVGVAVLTASVLGIKNKEAFAETRKSLKELIEKGSVGSERWFRNADLETLEKGRKAVQLDYMNPKLDIDYRSSLYGVLRKFDDAIRIKKYGNKECGFPVHSEHGWYLPSDD